MAGIEPEIECRAWTGMAEIAIALNKIDIAEKAITKGVRLFRALATTVLTV